jgi:prepilin-type N-terminal cleavage/methylation domain-containing protein
MKEKIKFQKGFTLIELLVVIAIIGLLSSIVLASLSGVRKKSRDAKRVAEIKELQLALELYFDSARSYPASGSWPSDCSGSTALQTALQPLVTGGFIGKIPTDPNFPNNPHPVCYYYQLNNNCNITGDPVHSYVLVFTTETTQLNYPSWSNETNRWCVYP